jgi:hypothetical protein
MFHCGADEKGRSLRTCSKDLSITIYMKPGLHYHNAIQKGSRIVEGSLPTGRSASNNSSSMRRRVECTKAAGKYHGIVSYPVTTEATTIFAPTTIKYFNSNQHPKTCPTKVSHITSQTKLKYQITNKYAYITCNDRPMLNLSAPTHQTTVQETV